jgi:hypothetical protein
VSALGDAIRSLAEQLDAIAAQPAPITTITPAPIAVPAPAASSDPNTTVLAQHEDGPTFMVSWDPATKATWVTSRSYMKRDGDGSFLSFQSQDMDGTFFDSVLLNGGLIDATPGKINSDLDVMLYVDGRACVIALTGRYKGMPPGIMCDPPDLFNIGSSYARFAELWLTPIPSPAHIAALPGNPKTCVKVSGGLVPIYDA